MDGWELKSKEIFYNSENSKITIHYKISNENYGNILFITEAPTENDTPVLIRVAYYNVDDLYEKGEMDIDFEKVTDLIQGDNPTYATHFANEFNLNIKYSDDEELKRIEEDLRAVYEIIAEDDGTVFTWVQMVTLRNIMGYAQVYGRNIFKD